MVQSATTIHQELVGHSRRCPPCPWLAYVALTLANLLDALTTDMGLQIGAPEANPLIRTVVAAAGSVGLWAVKLAGLCVVVALAEIARLQLQRSPVRLLWALSALVLVVAGNNLRWLIWLCR